jgi:hypothetical protein
MQKFTVRAEHNDGVLAQIVNVYAIERVYDNSVGVAVLHSIRKLSPVRVHIESVVAIAYDHDIDSFISLCGRLFVDRNEQKRDMACGVPVPLLPCPANGHFRRLNGFFG